MMLSQHFVMRSEEETCTSSLYAQIVTSHLPISSKHLPFKLQFCLGAKHRVYTVQIPLH